MSYTGRNFAIRTVQDGQITIRGKVLRPQEYYSQRDGWPTDTPYDGRLNGLRFAFGLYPYTTGLASLWGSEALFFNPNPEKDWTENEPYVFDGCIQWTWWLTEEEWQRTLAVWKRVEQAQNVTV